MKNSETDSKRLVFRMSSTGVRLAFYFDHCAPNAEQVLFNTLEAGLWDTHLLPRGSTRELEPLSTPGSVTIGFFELHFKEPRACGRFIAMVNRAEAHVLEPTLDSVRGFLLAMQWQHERPVIRCFLQE